MTLTLLRDQRRAFIGGQEQTSQWQGGQRIWMRHGLRPFSLAQDIPADLRVQGGLWEARRQQTADGRVTAWPDVWGVRDMVQAAAANRPAVGDVNGHAAAVWPDAISDVALVPAAAFNPRWWMFVIRYRNGVVGVFGGQGSGSSTGYPTIVSDGTSGTRVMGRYDSAELWPSAVAASTASRNARTYSATLLPLPLSLVEFRVTAPANVSWGIGRPSASGRAWNGPILIAMALGAEPAGTLLARIQGCVAWDYGLQASLPAGHPYRNARPMVAA